MVAKQRIRMANEKHARTSLREANVSKSTVTTRSDSNYSHSFDIYVIDNNQYGFVCVILNAYFVYSCKIVCLIHSCNVHLITLSFFRSNLGLC